MATKRWQGKALPRHQLDTLTLGGTWAAGDTITFTIGSNKAIVLTIGATFTTTVIADNILEAWNETSSTASFGTSYSVTEYGPEIPEFAEITAAKTSTTTVTFTGNTKGKPFSLAITRSTAASGTVALANTIVATGPNYWSNVLNWDTGAVPVSGVNEVQTVTVDATSGTFTVTFGGQTTAATAFNAAASLLQSNLEALSTIGAGNISVTGGPGASGGGTPFTLTFQNTMGYQNVAQVTCGAGTLSGGAATATPATGTPGSTGDDVYFDDSDVSVLYDISQAAIALNSINIAASYTGTIGLPKNNEDGDTYVEHRTDYLLIGATTINCGWPPGTGTGRFKINTGTIMTTLNIFGSGSPEETDLEAVLWKGTNAYNTINVSGTASLGMAVFGGETATVSTMTVDADATVRGGSVTITTLTTEGGKLQLAGSITTLTMKDGELLYLAGGITTLDLQGGSLVYNSTGTLGTASVSGGTLDFSQNLLTKVVTSAIDLYSTTGIIIDSGGTVSNLRVDFNKGATSEQVTWGNNVRLTRSAVS